jgi:hypothetical protein
LATLNCQFTNDKGCLITEANAGDKLIISLKAALNINWSKRDKGWIDVYRGDGDVEKVALEETGNNTGIFEGEYKVKKENSGKSLIFKYGYYGFGAEYKVAIK